MGSTSNANLDFLVGRFFREKESGSGMSSAGNDPRQPSAAKPYVAPVVPPENLPIDYSGFVAIVFGVAGVMFRVRLFLLSLP